MRIFSNSTESTESPWTVLIWLLIISGGLISLNKNSSSFGTWEVAFRANLVLLTGHSRWKNYRKITFRKRKFLRSNCDSVEQIVFLSLIESFSFNCRLESVRRANLPGWFLTSATCQIASVNRILYTFCHI